MNKTLFTLLAFVGYQQMLPAQTSRFNPSVSLLTSYTATQLQPVVSTGDFKTNNRKMNFGLEVTNTFSLPKNYFINTGLRVNAYKVTSTTLGMSFTRYSWDNKFASLTIPISIGRNFMTKNGNKGSYFAGLSAGVLVNTMQQQRMTSFSGILSAPDTTASSASGDMELAPTSFFATADLGVRYQPFYKAPRLQVGLMCSFQLNTAATINYNTHITETPGTAHDYQMTMNQRFFNCSFMVTYGLYRLKPRIPGTNRNRFHAS